MVIEPMTIGAVILIGLTSTYILISRDWRYTIAALTIQYIGIFLLVNISWPIEMAAAKMVAGWMAGAMLGIGVSNGDESWRGIEKSVTFGGLFRLISTSVIALTVTSLVIHSGSWLSSINPVLLWGSFFLVGVGLLQLSLTANPMRVVIGLLTALSGFEVLYASIETSVLVTGLLAVINLGLALVGAYLLVAPTMDLSQ